MNEPRCSLPGPPYNGASSQLTVLADCRGGAPCLLGRSSGTGIGSQKQRQFLISKKPLHSRNKLYFGSDTLFYCWIRICASMFINEIVHSTVLKWSWYQYYINILKTSWIKFLPFGIMCIRIICTLEHLVEAVWL